jgi:hypothetical protein
LNSPRNPSLAQKELFDLQHDLKQLERTIAESD